MHEIRREFVWNRTEYWMSSSSVLCMSCFIVKKRKMLFISSNFLFCFWVWWCMLMTLKQRKNKNNLRWKFTTTYILGNNHYFFSTCLLILDFWKFWFNLNVSLFRKSPVKRGNSRSMDGLRKCLRMKASQQNVSNKEKSFDCMGILWHL